MERRALPMIIQGGMGVGVSGWPLARAVSRAGQLGVIAGTALDVILARRLQDGDTGGHVRRALAHLPLPGVADRILARYFVPGGRPPDRPYRPVPMHVHADTRDALELSIAGNFVEVFLAREGHAGLVGINYLEKIQIPILPSLYGAMLAGVDAVLIGAGIPTRVPAILDAFAKHEPAVYPLAVTDARDGDDTLLRFDPRDFVGTDAAPLSRPLFLPIVSAATLALTLVRKSNGRVDGFVVEGPTAGGHNAPPRGKPELSSAGEPVYGERDVVDLEKMRALSLPFWLAGGRGTAEGLRDALAAGAAGIQVGTAFAFCEESGLESGLKARVLASAAAGSARVFTDPLASPTGFPFKVASVEGTLSEESVYADRDRVCDLGFLRESYRSETGAIAYRCPAEPEAIYRGKGGHAVTHGKKCLCNGLIANIGLAQVRGAGIEEPILTAGDDLAGIGRFLSPGATTYTAADVLAALLP